MAAGIAQLAREVLAIALQRHPLGQVAVLAQDQILAAHLAVVHLVAEPRIEALRMRLACLVELQSDVGIDAEREVIVDHVQRHIRLAPVHMILGDVVVRSHLDAPTVHEDALRHAHLAQYLAHRLVRVALKLEIGGSIDVSFA